MKAQTIVSKSSEETIKFGENLAKQFKSGDIVCFFGDLGSGKTTLIKGIAKGLKIRASKVNSPTFVLMNSYEGRLTLFHFDLYRLENIGEIHSIGFNDFLYDNGVSVIEWADRLDTHLPQEYLRISLMHKKFNVREIRLTAKGARYHNRFQMMGV